MAGNDQEGEGAGKGSAAAERGRGATEKALAELKASRLPSLEARRSKVARDIRMSVAKLLIGLGLAAGLGWLYWITESRWAFFGAAVLGFGPVIGGLRSLSRAYSERKALDSAGDLL